MQSLALLASSLVLCISPATAASVLYPQFYDFSCPQANDIVKSVVSKAVAREPRMAASLLRLHFQIVFVKGCDGSILLDSSGTITSEKRSVPNRDSVVGSKSLTRSNPRSKKRVPKPSLVLISWLWQLRLDCFDWWAELGRPFRKKGLIGASLSGSNQNIPAPNNTFQTILTKFKLKSHHRNARCTSFRQRLYNNTGNGQPDFKLEQSYAARLRVNCPRTGGDQNLFPMDPDSPTKFDNGYYKNLMALRGLLSSDEILYTQNQETYDLVKHYAENQHDFFKQFAKSMIKMGNITPLTGNQRDQKHLQEDQQLEKLNL
ncbi:putative peroxidase [Helianthus annuus]|nr:putative peroxidase [Helianthus annuus]